VTGIGSSTGGVAFGVGFVPAAVVTAVLLMTAVDRVAEDRLAPVGAVVPPAIAAAALATLSIVPSYRDGPIGALNARIASGPWAGLSTTTAKRAFLERLTEDLADATPYCGILFFNDFPGGYLVTRARPATNSTWITGVPKSKTPSWRRELADYYRRHAVPDVVVKMKVIPYDPPGTVRREAYARGSTPLDVLGPKRYVEELIRRDYVVYRRRGAACPAGQRAPRLRISISPSQQGR
jgi:hypothetical protein